MTGEKQLCLRDIERLNIFDFLQPYKEKIRDVFDREGTAAARMYIYKVFNVRMKAREIRDFLSVDTDKGAIIAREAHRLAWDNAGWNGRYSPLGYGPGEDKRTALLAAGVLRKGEKMCVVRS
ncbi:MAG: hypothetical protein HPY89_03725 [Pelotomaculum sp.]|nr:hypothetical protein [Pelotomaculum sp.]